MERNEESKIELGVCGKSVCDRKAFGIHTKRMDCSIYGVAIHIPYFIPHVKVNKEPDIKAYYQSARKN